MRKALRRLLAIHGFRLDWKGLSFVWTGDPDVNPVKFCKGVDVFVKERDPIR